MRPADVLQVAAGKLSVAGKFAFQPAKALLGQKRHPSLSPMDTILDKPDLAARLSALRSELKRRGLDGFVVPRADEHQGEMVAPHSERLAWLTGFTGSAGQAIVLADRAAIFVDGRYTLQVGLQVDTRLISPLHMTENPASAWIEENLEGGKLGYDPWLHSEDQVRRLKESCEKAGGEAVAVSDNPVDAIWSDQPDPPKAPAAAHPLEFAGKTSAEKRDEIAAAIAAAGASAAVLSLPDSLAWLLNVRGGDVSHTPLVLSFGILDAEGGCEWFVDGAKISEDLPEHLGNGVSPRAPEEFGPALDALAGRKVLADPASAPAWVFDRLREAGAEIVQDQDPCLLPKARKNAIEIEGCRAAHRRDGAALSRFLAWLASNAVDGEVSELEAAGRLRRFREENSEFRDLSFDTISGSGPNGAIVHYRVTPESDRRLGDGELFLLDSGAQYPDGTTDVTRTVAIGKPSPEMRERFTRVLKGHIALATARFPVGTTGSQLDALARSPLWQAGLDYDHGTGHGVGSYLGVHEGPQRISKVPNRVALEPGMIVSNEPGYYKTGAYGIRIENLVTVVESPAQPGDDRAMLAFETLTLAPIDLSLVEPSLLTAEEAAWLDSYHERVRETLSPALGAADRVWLDAATAKLGA